MKMWKLILCFIFKKLKITFYFLNSIPCGTHFRRTHRHILKLCALTVLVPSKPHICGEHRLECHHVGSWPQLYCELRAEPVSYSMLYPRHITQH